MSKIIIGSFIGCALAILCTVWVINECGDGTFTERLYYRHA